MISRRDFVKGLTSAGITYSLQELLITKTRYLKAAEMLGRNDPLEFYPDRKWEVIYRDIIKEDDSFVFLCAPNDTHNCLLRAFLKNGVITRISPTYGYGEAKDSYGNKASHRWDPRCCQKGLVMARRFYGDRRVKSAMIRQGFKDWADAGFPRDKKKGKPKMDTTKRGEDKWIKLSWNEAFDIAARAYLNIIEAYSGEKGKNYLSEQGYDPAMVEAMHGAGVLTTKHRGGMPLLGIGRLFGLYRFANMLALVDQKVRAPKKDEIVGGKTWDNYSWHTDLPPGHPMVTGSQTVEFDLFATEQADLVVIMGMNWISTKMPDGHWLGDARLKGTKIINISTDYQSTSNKADEVIIIRPGTDAALAYCCCNYILKNNLYDEKQLSERTDLPLLVRLDNMKLLNGKDLVKDYKPKKLTNYVTLQTPKEANEEMPPAFTQDSQLIPEAMRDNWGDFTVWDKNEGELKIISRDQVGEIFKKTGIEPALTGEFEVTDKDGKRVKVTPVFELVKKYISDNFDLETTSEITWAPREAIEDLAKQLVDNKKKSLIAVGMGPNHFFNADLKDRAIFLLCALTDNIGHISGNIGSYAGNYRGSVFQGAGQWILEDPFNIELDVTKPANRKKYSKSESAHYYNYGDRPLRVGNKLFTGKTHVPTPTKLMFFANSNSILGNAKWHYDVVKNTLPGVEAVFCNEWWWTTSCEYADIVFGVDSWAETQLPDMTGSCTNPFLQIYPRSKIKRIHDTRSDYEVCAGIAKALGEITGDSRMEDFWKYIYEGKPEGYLQRVLNASNATRRYKFTELEEKAKQGVPALMNFRTYPRQGGWEQTKENRPWYNRSGRLEFYRDEAEWIEAGENIPIWREPVDGTFYEPNIILNNASNPAVRPNKPEVYGLNENDLAVEVRQVRNVIKSWSELKKTKHPLNIKDKNFKFIFLTPKFRWGSHTTPTDIDWIAMMFGPFGDIYRHDKRMPYAGEGYMGINPQDAKQLGIEDGDYVWIDADPSDRPYRNLKKKDPFYKVARVMARARYYNGLPPGVTLMWFNMYGATKGSVKGQLIRKDGLAKNPETGYQSLFRHGSHQSPVRAWLKPTLMTDTMVRKNYFGQVIRSGYEGDVHTVVGAPKESFVKIEKAENGGFNGKCLWRPAALGLRAGYESEDMKRYMSGDFIK